jgi:hypothetical protein
MKLTNISRIRAISAFVTAILFPGASVPGQSIPTRTLASPETEFATPFTQIAGVRELRDGRVILIDERDRVVQLLDLASGTATTIGRQGSGPGEYRLPIAIFALSGDSTGPIYASGVPWSNRGGVFQSLDSVPLLRWSRGTSRIDTLGYIGRPKGFAKSSMRGRAHVIRVGPSVPFTPIDQFAVSMDGRVAIVDADDYRITWSDLDGRRTRTAPIAHSPLRVTEAHKPGGKLRKVGSRS